MEQVKHRRKALFVFVWGVLVYGGSMAMAVNLFDWYANPHIVTPRRIVGQVVEYMAVGVVVGLFMWNRLEALGHKKLTRTGNILRVGLFISLMLGLAYTLWSMTRH